MPTPKIVLTADRTLMSPYRGLSLATFFGCAPAIDENRDKASFWYKILGKQVTPKVLFDFICNWSPDIWCWARALSSTLGGKDVFGISQINRIYEPL